MGDVVERSGRMSNLSTALDHGSHDAARGAGRDDGGGKRITDLPEFDGEPEGKLLGTQDLPMVGAAGVLVLPQRLPSTAPKSRGMEVPDPLDVALGFAGGGLGCDLIGWGTECLKEDNAAPYKMFDNAATDSAFAAYVVAEVVDETAQSSSDSPRLAQPDIEHVKALAAELGPMKPKEGPGLVQLARDPKRREECPVCAAEWSQALKALSDKEKAGHREADPDDLDALLSAPSRRQIASGKNGKVKMHSLRCHWMWFQQSLCTALCSLRFDDKGEPRPHPGSPSNVVPPAVYDTWHYWRQKTGRGGAERAQDRASATDRLYRGEAATGA